MLVIYLTYNKYWEGILHMIILNHACTECLKMPGKIIFVIEVCDLHISQHKHIKYLPVKTWNVLSYNQILHIPMCLA